MDKKVYNRHDLIFGHYRNCDINKANNKKIKGFFKSLNAALKNAFIKDKWPSWTMYH